MNIKYQRIIYFLALNFLALYFGSLVTTDGVSSSWYQQLQKAPWTPPGWVFGAAWTSIMICFSIYMALSLGEVERSRNLLLLYLLQWLLNVIWNPVFFYYQQVQLGLLVILSLSSLIAYLFFNNIKILRWKSLWIFPYLSWMMVASSLNFYIWFYN